MLSATCHCGAVRIDVPKRPPNLTNCNCSICRRYGALWAYYKAPFVRLTAPRGATDEYAWGHRRLKFIRCATCGCVLCFQRRVLSPRAYTGVNMRNFDPDELGAGAHQEARRRVDVEVRRLTDPSFPSFPRKREPSDFPHRTGSPPKPAPECFNRGRA